MKARLRQLAGLAIGAALLAATGLLGAGCNSMFEEGWRVSRPRVMGLRVVVEEDPTRSWPRPGEAAQIEWLLAAPTPDGEVRSSFLVCVASPTLRGASSCAGPPLAFVPPTTTSSESLPSLSFVVPEAEGLAGASSLLVLGMVCEEGEPSLGADGGLPTCEGGPEQEQGNESTAAMGTTLVLSTILLDVSASTGVVANRHPTLADETFTLIQEGAEQPWEAPPSALPFTGCAASAVAGSPALPLMRPMGSDGEGGPAPLSITWTSSEGDRELYEQRYLGDPPTTRELLEDLQFTHASTFGAPDRQFSILEGEASPPPTGELGWAWPALEEVPAEGQLVRFWFVVRDLRGGIDWVERAFCALPE